MSKLKYVYLVTKNVKVLTPKTCDSISFGVTLLFCA